MRCFSLEECEKSSRYWTLLQVLAILLILPQLWGCAPEAKGEPSGVHVSGVRLIGADNFVDLRFRITDPQKASSMLSDHVTPLLIDQETGKEFPVPVTKLGFLKATAAEPEMGREYMILFSNVDYSLTKGSRVTVVSGDLRIEDLTVE